MDGQILINNSDGSYERSKISNNQYRFKKFTGEFARVNEYSTSWIAFITRLPRSYIHIYIRAAKCTFLFHFPSSPRINIIQVDFLNLCLNQGNLINQENDRSTIRRLCDDKINAKNRGFTRASILFGR